MVEIKNLTKYYGNNPAVRGIDFESRDNEILGFLGPNGAGKSHDEHHRRLSAFNGRNRHCQRF